VQLARAVQLERAGKLNARLDTRQLWRAVELRSAERTRLKRAVERWQLSARSTLRVLKVARTIADLERQADVATQHVAEALQLRCRERPR
jgi:magnesium chelatase family protein